ncbi:hypothetical protein D3C75_1122790 [compost metagenome]
MDTSSLCRLIQPVRLKGAVLLTAKELAFPAAGDASTGACRVSGTFHQTRNAYIAVVTAQAKNTSCMFQLYNSRPRSGPAAAPKFRAVWNRANTSGRLSEGTTSLTWALAAG